MIKNKKYQKSNFNNKEPISSINWNITQACNYNCSYCFSKGSNKKISDLDPYIFLDVFSKTLSGSWRFYLGGEGEPFMSPNISLIVKELTKMGHSICIVTNFSVSLKKLLKICTVADNHLLSLSASLHLEFVNPDDFLKKAFEIKQIIGHGLTVTSVARKGQVLKLEKIGQTFRKKGIRFLMQSERVTNHPSQPFVRYTKQEIDIIRNFNKEKFLSDKNVSRLEGKLCWAGSKYFLVTETGDAWRCYPARKHKDTKGYLGNLLKDTFKLRENSSPCLYKNCYCRVPIRNNMIINETDL